jgi:hypothetical protein
MTIRAPFKPHYGSTVGFSAAIGSASITVGGGDKTLLVINTGATNPMFFRTGKAADGAVVATAADVPVYAGKERFIEKPTDHDTLASISALGTTAVVMSGEGGA